MPVAHKGSGLIVETYLAIFAQPLKKVKIRASQGSSESSVGKVKPLDW